MRYFINNSVVCLSGGKYVISLAYTADGKKFKLHGHNCEENGYIMPVCKFLWETFSPLNTAMNTKSGWKYMF